MFFFLQYRGKWNFFGTHISIKKWENWRHLKMAVFVERWGKSEKEFNLREWKRIQLKNMQTKRLNQSNINNISIIHIQSFTSPAWSLLAFQCVMSVLHFIKCCHTHDLLWKLCSHRVCQLVFLSSPFYKEGNGGTESFLARKQQHKIGNRVYSLAFCCFFNRTAQS